MPYELFRYWVSYFTLKEMEYDKKDYAFAKLNASVTAIATGKSVSEQSQLIRFVTPDEIKEEQDKKDINFMNILKNKVTKNARSR